MDDDDAWFGQKQSADGVVGDVPLRGKLGDCEMPLKDRRVVLRIHLGQAPVELSPTRCCVLFDLQIRSNIRSVEVWPVSDTGKF